MTEKIKIDKIPIKRIQLQILIDWFLDINFKKGGFKK